MFKKYLYASLAGLAIGLITIYVLPSEFELFLWPMLIVIIGHFAARELHKAPFWVGFRYALAVGIKYYSRASYFYKRLPA